MIDGDKIIKVIKCTKCNIKTFQYEHGLHTWDWWDLEKNICPRCRGYGAEEVNEKHLTEVEGVVEEDKQTVPTVQEKWYKPYDPKKGLAQQLREQDQRMEAIKEERRGKKTNDDMREV